MPRPAGDRGVDPMVATDQLALMPRTAAPLVARTAALLAQAVDRRVPTVASVHGADTAPAVAVGEVAAEVRTAAAEVAIITVRSPAYLTTGIRRNWPVAPIAMRPMPHRVDAGAVATVAVRGAGAEAMDLLATLARAVPPARGRRTTQSAGGDCGGCGGCDGCSGAVMEGTIIEGDASPSSMESEPMEETPSEARKSSRKGVLTVSVPAHAEIVVNGLPTTSTGEQRRYVSHGLKPGEDYRYVVKATIEQDGQNIEQTKVATLRAGKVTDLDFDFSDRGVVETSLTLNVPDDAKVFLSGTETGAKGPTRRFSTTRIQDGQKWADYLVRTSRSSEMDGR